MHSIVVKSVDIHCGFSFYALYQSPAFLLTFMMLAFKQRGSDDYLTGVICAELLVGNNVTNNGLNELFNFFYSWSLIDWMSFRDPAHANRNYLDIYGSIISHISSVWSRDPNTSSFHDRFS